MSTSGTYNHNVSGTEIIEDALLKCGAKEEGEDIPPEGITSGLRQLNNLVKFIASKQTRNLWRRDEVMVFLDPEQPKYLLGPSNTDAEWCLESQFTDTKLNGAASEGDTSLIVDSTEDMRAGDRFGLEMDDNTRDWSSITSIDSATTLTVPPITGDAADNATVYTYTTKTSEVIKVETLVDGALNAGVVTIVTDSTTGISTGDRFSYVATDGTTVFSKITAVVDGTDLTVPATAKPIADDARLIVYKTDVNQNAITTTLTGAATTADETIGVESTAGLSAGDVISVLLSDASLAWMAIEHVVSSTILAIPPIPGGADNGAAVTGYVIKPPRPLRVLHARRRTDPDGEDINIDIESQEMYRDQPLKTNNGTPVFLTFKATLTAMTVEIWQPPNSVQMFIGLTVERPFEDFDAAGNSPDFPQEWFDPLVYIMAERLEPEYRILDPVRLQMLSKKAEEMWDWVNEFDDDLGSFYIHPDFQGSQGYGP